MTTYDTMRDNFIDQLSQAADDALANNEIEEAIRVKTTCLNEGLTVLAEDIEQRIKTHTPQGEPEQI